VVITGICISAAIWQASKSVDDVETIMEDMRFDADVFFYLILPLIVFPSGYNMRRKKFFANIGTIMKFGFVGTIICFAIYTGMTYGALKAGWLTKTDLATGN
jgi:NhaP-type Na+/H+ or K+/H+ antiporter